MYMFENLVVNLQDALEESGSYVMDSKEIYLVLALIGELEEFEKNNRRVEVSRNETKI